MPDPLISILLPVKNASAYLDECIDSISKQTEINWELIAVEDHSDDDSYHVLKTHAFKDSRIKVFKNEGNGIIHALRKAYTNSSGILITRMDADDIMELNKLEKLKAILLNAGKGHLATGLVKYFSSSTLRDGYLKYEDWLNTLSLEEKNYSDVYKECVVPSPCWMVFREDLNRCGAFEPNDYPEDYDLCFRFYKNGLIVKTAKEHLHRWRDYPERTSRNDPNYADVHFFDLKLKYFLEIDHQPERSLVLWGAGRKGKELARGLKSQELSFYWITDNLKKIGKDIYNTKLESTDILKSLSNYQLIIAIATPNIQSQLSFELTERGLKKNKDFFLFC